MGATDTGLFSFVLLVFIFNSYENVEWGIPTFHTPKFHHSHTLYVTYSYTQHLYFNLQGRMHDWGVDFYPLHDYAGSMENKLRDTHTIKNAIYLNLLTSLLLLISEVYTTSITDCIYAEWTKKPYCFFKV